MFWERLGRSANNDATCKETSPQEDRQVIRQDIITTLTCQCAHCCAEAPCSGRGLAQTLKG